jgi:DNA-binding transcriptional ArsR family regulator
MVREKDYNFIMGNKTRREILNLIENKSLNASQIKEALKLSSYGLLYQHLKVLEEVGIITRQQIKDEAGKKKQGRETKISINTKGLNRFMKTQGILPDVEIDEKVLRDILKFLSTKEEPVSFYEIVDGIHPQNKKIKYEDFIGEVQALIMDFPELFLYKLSKEGIENLNKNSKLKPKNQQKATQSIKT